MKQAKLETLMIIAIKEFSQNHDHSHIVSCKALESYGKGKAYCEAASFEICYYNEEIERYLKYETFINASIY